MPEVTKRALNDKSSLKPTSVELDLVNVLIDEHDNWPAVYLEMTKVSEDDLLSDAEFCQRHKRPSLTAFFVECGEIAGVNISTLRKYQRAGVYYESARNRHPELPSIVDNKVKNVPPDLLSFVSKINDSARQSDSDSESLDRLEVQYILGTLNGKITRMKLMSDLARYRSGLDNNNVTCSLLELENLNNNETGDFSKRDDMAFSFTLEKTKIDERKKEKIRTFLSKDAWARPLTKGPLGSRPHFTVYAAHGPSVCGAIRFGGGKRFPLFALFPDFVVVEDSNLLPCIHSFEIVNCQDLESSRVIYRLNQQIYYSDCETEREGASVLGFDYFWVVLTSNQLSQEDIEEFGLAEEIGVMLFGTKGLSILRMPKRLSSNDKRKLALYQAFTLYLACLKK